jgi:hypothetical protein
MSRWREVSPEVQHYEFTATKTKRGLVQHLKKDKAELEHDNSTALLKTMGRKKQTLDSQNAASSSEILNQIPDDAFNVYSTADDFISKPANVRCCISLH